MLNLPIRAAFWVAVWLFFLPLLCFSQTREQAFLQSDEAALPSAPQVTALNAAAESQTRILTDAVAAQFTPSFLVDQASADAAGAYSEDSPFGNILLAQATPPPQTEPGKASEPTLGDLGFPNSQTRGSTADQARLDKRSHMLRVHQRLGLITTVPLVATILVSGLAGGHSTSSTGRDIHATLGTITAGMYLTTAYYSIFAPRIPGTTTRGPIRWHKALAFIHGPGMILTPILGAMAFDQKSKGERVHGIASAHGAVGAITAIAYGAAILSVSIKF